MKQERKKLNIRTREESLEPGIYQLNSSLQWPGINGSLAYSYAVKLTEMHSFN